MSEPLPLTGREHEIVRMIAAGMSNKDIAEALTISRSTVSTHVSNVLVKLGVRTRVQAALRCAELLRQSTVDVRTVFARHPVAAPAAVSPDQPRRIG